MSVEITKVEGEEVFSVSGRLTTLAKEQDTLADLKTRKVAQNAQVDKQIADQQAIVDGIEAVN